MHYNVISCDGYGLPVAKRLLEEGNSVRVGQVTDQSQTVLTSEGTSVLETVEVKSRRLSLYDGLLSKESAELVTSEVPDTSDDAFWLFDLNNLFRFASKVAPYTVLGNFPSEDDLRMEIERERAKAFVAAHYPALRSKTYHHFAKIEEACRFLEVQRGRWVLKGNAENATTVVPYSPSAELACKQLEVCLRMHRAEYESGGFTLEEFIPDAIELTPERYYFDGKHIATLICIENKSLGGGNLGPMTDCAQDLVFLISPEDLICKIAFPPVVDQLAARHKGLFIWDASIYFDPSNDIPYFGEFCSNRFGYNSFYSELTLAGSTTSFFEHVVRGECPFPKDEAAVSVRLFNVTSDDTGQPPVGTPIILSEQAGTCFWGHDVRLEGKDLTTAGFTEGVGVVTASSTSLEGAIKALYDTTEQIIFDGSMYRPISDYQSREYSTSILRRLDYGIQQGLFLTHFSVDL